MNRSFSLPRNSNFLKLMFMLVLAVISVFVYLFINIDMKYFDYAMYIRTPKLYAMVIAAFCIGTASIAFQTVINNTIVTPCLLGMNGLYTLVRTIMVFFLGSGSIFVYNANIAFLTNLSIMLVAAMIIYGYLFKVTKYNVLYILLAGSVLTTLYGSISSTLMRVMDPNAYDTLQTQLIAGFNNVNSDILLISVVICAFVILFFWRYIRVLDVVSLGRNQAINLGVNYDKTIGMILLAVTILIAVATALVGPLSFLGLIIANISRQLFKTYKHTYLLLGSALAGIIVLVAGQVMIEHVLSFSTTISVIINIAGGGYFLYLIMKNRGA